MNTISNIEKILNDDDFSVDTVGTPKEGAEQHICLKGAISKIKVYLLASNNNKHMKG